MGLARLSVAFVFLGVLEGSRIPADLPECESELVSGYVTELAGLGYGLIASTEYAVVLAGAFTLGALLGAGNLAVVGLVALAYFTVCLILRLTLPRFRLQDLLPLVMLALIPLLASMFGLATATSMVCARDVTTCSFATLSHPT